MLQGDLCNVTQCVMFKTAISYQSPFRFLSIILTMALFSLTGFSEETVIDTSEDNYVYSETGPAGLVDEKTSKKEIVKLYNKFVASEAFFGPLKEAYEDNSGTAAEPTTIHPISEKDVILMDVSSGGGDYFYGYKIFVDFSTTFSSGKWKKFEINVDFSSVLNEETGLSRRKLQINRVVVDPL